MSGAEPVDLDDVAALEALDSVSLLRICAGSGAQVRSAVDLSGDMRLEAIADLRPRAVVVTGIGGSGTSGDMLAAVTGGRAAAPVVLHRGYGLPGWVGAADLVIGVARSGRTPQTVSALEQAVARGASVGGVGAADSPLEDIVGRGRGSFAAVTVDAPPRGALWAMTTPLLLMARAAGVADVTDEALAAAADRLDEIAERCRPTSESFVNPGKVLGADLVGTRPMIWGSSPLAGTAARRFGAQLAENAKIAAVTAELPDAAFSLIEVLRPGDDERATRDIFADPVQDTEPSVLRLVLLRDTDEPPAIAARVEAALELAAEAGVEVSTVRAESADPLTRLAELVAVPDFASIYCGLAQGLDPSPVPNIHTATQAAGE